MSRRSFLKWLIGLTAMLATAWLAFYKWLSGSDSPYTVLSNGDAEPDPSPATSVKVTPTPEPPSAVPLLSLFVLSDMHVSMYDATTSEKLKLALNDVSAFETPVDTILLGGDLTDYGTPMEYGLLKDILAAYKLPKLHGNMGNHDYYDVWIDKNGGFNTAALPNGKTDAQSRQRFQQFLGYEKPYHAEVMNGVLLVMLSQEAYMQERPEVGEGAWYSEEQLHWLKAKLAEHTDGKPILVLIHQPLPNQGEDGGSHRLIPAKAFRDMLKPYPNVFVVSGHTHQDFDNGTTHYIKETFHWIVNASVGRTRSGGQVKSQGLYVQFYKDRVELRGREFSKKAWIDAARWSIPLERAKA
ncbi:metallophosphoesterase [Paenibacillus sp. HJGM_3]|uniref:metallophosphoesterase n=1 Tax=Paenibacillus sp. HJGM_3 TaxID=3379816 RepID=UPI00385E04DF